jgi:multidrug efflux pump
VVVYWVMFSLLLTLYVVPVIYGYVARNTRSPEYIAHLIDRLRRAARTLAPRKRTPPSSGKP